MKEPARENSIYALCDYVANRVHRIVKRLRERGFDPLVFETRRSVERQRWLYGQGRSKWQCIKAGISPAYSHKGPIVTYTLKSIHLVGKAADIISESNLWNDAAFFAALKEEAAKERMHTLGFEGCHVEWRG